MQNSPDVVGADRKASGRTLILSLGRNGGCVRYAAEIIQAWSGPPFDLVLSRFSTEPAPAVPHRTLSTYRSRGEFAARTVFVYPFLLARLFLALLLGRYQSLYLPYFHHWEWGPVLMFRLFGRRIVYTVHDGVQHSGEEDSIGAFVMKRSIMRATDLIFLTSHVAEGVLKRLAPSGRVHVIPHGVFSLSGVNSVRSHARRPVVLFLGRILPYKGVEILAEAVRSMGRSEFDRLIIAGSSRYRLNIAPFDGLEVIDRWLTDAEIAEFLNAAHVLVIPYTEATQSGVIMLGVQAALPMVCTRVAGLEEQLTPAEAIFVEPRPEQICAGIRRLAADPVLYDGMCKQLRSRAASMSWNTIARSIANAFRNSDDRE
jgi:glycosyltransferase involved in cell wall biosynthesis